MKLSSKAFTEGGMIPQKYSFKADNISPPLEWDYVPPNTKSLALIVDDPDAPMLRWVHWIVYNIPATQNNLKEGILPEGNIEVGIKQGINSWRKIGYGGPSPPWGTHRYIFKLYALDKELDIDSGLSKSELIKKMEGHILDEAELVGKYQK
ncbi:MAG TPA: YbhB/YbcL family Raf kinase inhibitor-like protein [Candidatus Methanofastidiosum sp.]|nr:YbhB/YbcL family Raf kinase inhibitor-like protein [Methanofastidiosum sp.]